MVRLAAHAVRVARELNKSKSKSKVEPKTGAGSEPQALDISSVEVDGAKTNAPVDFRDCGPMVVAVRV